MDSQNSIDMDDRKRKQAYLKDEILAQGYDGLKFSEYMCTIKPDGNNIDRWTFEALITAVRSFKKLEGNLSFQEQRLDESTLSLLQLFDRADINLTSSNLNNTKLFPTIDEQKQDDMILPSLARNLDEIDEQYANSERTSSQFLQVPSSSRPNRQPSKDQTIPLGQSYQRTKSPTPNESLASSQANNTQGSIAPANTSSFSKQSNSHKSQVIYISPPPVDNSDTQLQTSSISQESTRNQKSPQPTYYKQTIHTTLPAATKLSQESNVIIAVKNPEQIKGGVFSSSYVQYTVATEPLGWVVKRRYNDFFWLRDTLQRLHPGVVIPPIPSKKSKNKFQEEEIRKRMYFFETFLNACMEHEDLKADKHLCNFLHMPDGAPFKKAQEQADKIPRPTKVDDVSSTKAYIMLDSNPDFSRYISLVDTYCGDTNPIYKRIRKVSKALMISMKQASSLSLDLNDCFKSLQELTGTFNQRVPPTQTLRFESIYTTLCKMMTSWGELFSKQANVVYKNLFCFYKYSALENDVFKELNQFKAKSEEEFMKYIRELNIKKDKLYTAGDMTKWDLDVSKARNIPRDELAKDKTLAFSLMLSSETKDLTQLKDIIAYLNYNTSAEISKALDMRCYRYNTNFQEFINGQFGGLYRLQKSWDNIFNTPVEGRSRGKAILTSKSFAADSTVETSTNNTNNTILSGSQSSRRNFK